MVSATTKYGRPKNSDGGTIFELYTRPSDGKLRATDAKLIGELGSTYISAIGQFSSPSAERLVITTPNADYLPLVDLGNQIVAMCEDGRWGASDWSQWPQWYFDANDHLPYILRKPGPDALEQHPMRFLWWTFTKQHFVPEEGQDDGETGRLAPNIAQRLYDIREKLMQEVHSCVCPRGEDFQRLQAMAAQMRFTTSSLRFTPHKYLDVVILVTAAQRYCLETRAMLDKIQKWDIFKPTVTEESPLVDGTIIGTVTDRTTVAFEMQEKGVPVWLVRPPQLIPNDINIVGQYDLEKPSRHIITTRWPGGPIFYQGPLTHKMYNAIQQWKPGQVNLTVIETTQMLDGPAHSPGPTRSTDLRSEDGKKHGRKPYLRPHDQKSATKRTTINEKRFRPLLSTFSPSTITSWSDALLRVDVDTSRLVDHPGAGLFKGFAFPDSPIFLGDDNEKTLGLVIAWLIIRASWMSSLNEVNPRNLPLPNPQQWRAFLHDISLDLELVQRDTRIKNPKELSPDHKIARSTRRNIKSKAVAQNIFNVSIPDRQALHFVKWNDRTVWTRDRIDLTPLDRRLIVWDIQEHNFCLELFTLDKCLLRDLWADSESASLRERKLHAVFDQETILMMDLPKTAANLASTHWEDRRVFVDAFRSVLLDWPGAPRLKLALEFKKSVDDRTLWHRDNMLKVESIAFHFYCQTFFDHFACAPCVPFTFPTS